MTAERNATQSPAKVSYTEIADLAGVSIATVSRVLNSEHLVAESTKSRVYDAMERLGRPIEMRTKSARHGHNNIIIINIPTLGNPFYNPVVQGAMTAAKSHGYQMLINTDPLDDEGCTRTLALFRSIQAIGLISCNAITKNVLARLNSQIPLVQCCEYCDDVSNTSYVAIDNMLAASKAVEYLITLGCTRVGIITGPMQYKYAQHRLAGYLGALKKASLPINENYIIQVSDVSHEIAYSACQGLFHQTDRPQAVFAVSDVFAAAAIRAAVSCGLSIPKDLAVIGFDNIDISMLTTPSLTTINQPQFQIGYSAAEILIEQIENPEAPIHRLMMDVELIIRESTRATF